MPVAVERVGVAVERVGVAVERVGVAVERVGVAALWTSRLTHTSAHWLNAFTQNHRRLYGFPRIDFLILRLNEL